MVRFRALDPQCWARCSPGTVCTEDLWPLGMDHSQEYIRMVKEDAEAAALA